jgi:hypothetical protein
MYLAHNKYQTHNVCSVTTLLTPTTHNISVGPAICLTPMYTLPVLLSTAPSMYLAHTKYQKSNTGIKIQTLNYLNIFVPLTHCITSQSQFETVIVIMLVLVNVSYLSINSNGSSNISRNITEISHPFTQFNLQFYNVSGTIHFWPYLVHNLLSA